MIDSQPNAKFQNDKSKNGHWTRGVIFGSKSLLFNYSKLFLSHSLHSSQREKIICKVYQSRLTKMRIVVQYLRTLTMNDE